MGLRYKIKGEFDMENYSGGLREQQAFLNAPKNQETSTTKPVYVERPMLNNPKVQQSEEQKKVEAEKMEKSAQWFKTIAPGTILYAIVYAICMYKNPEGIGVPFGVGATLYFFYYYAKKFYGTARKCDMFLMITTVILGIITCTTTSEPLIYMNKLGIFLLAGIYLLELFFDVTGWSFMMYVKGGWYAFWGGVSLMVVPFVEGSAFLKLMKAKKDKAPMDEKTKEKLLAIIVGIVVAIPVVFVLVLLLASADLYFREMSGNLIDSILYWETPELFNRDFFGFLGTILVAFLFGYGVITYINTKDTIVKETSREGIKANPYIAISCSAMIAFVYLVFVGIQIFGLFMGALTLPDGYTYAEYARQGFFQLTFVCFFNVCMVLVCMACFEDNTVLKWIMAIISGCTYVMLVSAAYRMLLYISVYHLTFLRVFVLWAIAVMAITMVGITVFIFKKEFPIFKYILVSITVLYIGFTAAHPDFWIAKYNIEQANEEEGIDEYHLLFNLSLDAAVPVLDYYEESIENPKGYYNEYLEKYCLTDISARVKDYCIRIEEAEEEMNARTFNFSKAIAGYKLKQYDIPKDDM